MISDAGDSSRLFRADGTPVADAELPTEDWAWSQAVAPDARGFVQLTVHDRPDDDEERWDLRLAWLRKGVRSDPGFLACRG